MHMNHITSLYIYGKCWPKWGHGGGPKQSDISLIGVIVSLVWLGQPTRLLFLWLEDSSVCKASPLKVRGRGCLIAFGETYSNN